MIMRGAKIQACGCGQSNVLIINYGWMTCMEFKLWKSSASISSPINLIQDEP